MANTEYDQFECDVEFSFYLLKTEEGGRQSPVKNGYRPDICNLDHDWGEHLWGSVKEFSQEWIQLGDLVQVKVRFHTPEVQYGRYYIGKQVHFQEGGRIIGKAYVTKIHNPKLEYWNFETFLRDQAQGKSYLPEEIASQKIESLLQRQLLKRQDLQVISRSDPEKGLCLALVMYLPVETREIAGVWDLDITPHEFNIGQLRYDWSSHRKHPKYPESPFPYYQLQLNQRNFITWNEEHYWFGSIFVVPHFYSSNHIDFLFDSQRIFR